MKGFCLRRIALCWPVGSALLLLALAGPTFAAVSPARAASVPPPVPSAATSRSGPSGSRYTFEPNLPHWP